MVFSTSIILLGLNVVPAWQQYNEAFFLNKASELRQAILVGTPGFIEQTSTAGSYFHLLDPLGGHVSMGDSSYSFNPNTGKLNSLLGHGQIDSPPVGSASIETAQASSIALALANILEGVEDRKTYVFPPEPGSNNLIVYYIKIFPAHQGLAFQGSDFGASTELEHSTGKILSYRTAVVPRCLAPANLVPTITLSEAEATVASHVGNISDPPPVVVLGQTELVVFKPDTDWMGPNSAYKTTWFTTTELADFNSNRGVLAYSSSMARINAFVPHLNNYATKSLCYVNAHTGQLMAEYVSTGIGAGIEGKPRRIAPFAGELDAGTLTINMGKRSVTIADAATTLVPPPKSIDPKNRAKVMLKRGRLFIQAEFDPKSGLLRFGGKAPVWAKPNPALLNALMKLK